MLDHLRLAIPVHDVYVRSVGDNHHYFNGDLIDLGLPCATRSVSRLDDGTVMVGDLYHPYESLPSCYTDMAVKFYNNTMNTNPYLELKASPLKLLQGHNVYGFDSIKNGACEMLGLLLNAYPELCKVLDFRNIEVLHLDATFFFRLPHQNMVQPVLNYLSNCSAGHRKPKSVKFSNYVTWNNSRYLNIKAYGKFLEVMQQIKELSSKDDKRSVEILKAMQGALDFANGVVRLESRICKTYLSKNGYPSNLWELIAYQEAHPDLLPKLWNIAFSPILNTLKGENMRFSSDDEVLELLRSKLWTVTAKGRKSFTKADNAFKFYNLIEKLGWVAVKEIYSNSTFYDNVKNLVDCGISRSHLQNLNQSGGGKIIPFTRLVEINFNEQLPADYQMPVSKFIEVYEVLKAS